MTRNIMCNWSGQCDLHCPALRALGHGSKGGRNWVRCSSQNEPAPRPRNCEQRRGKGRWPCDNFLLVGDSGGDPVGGEERDSKLQPLGTGPERMSVMRSLSPQIIINPHHIKINIIRNPRRRQGTDQNLNQTCLLRPQTKLEAIT